MLALHETAADIQRARIDFRNAERVKADGRAADVDDGVGRADFVERHVVLRDAVHRAFGLGEHVEDVERLRLRARRERRALDHRADVRHRAMSMGMMCFRMRLWFGFRRTHIAIKAEMMVGMERVRMLAQQRRRRILAVFVLLVLIRERDVDVERRDARFLHGRDRELALLHDGELGEFLAQELLRYAGREERAEEHIAADAGKGIEINRF